LYVKYFKVILSFYFVSAQFTESVVIADTRSW